MVGHSLWALSLTDPADPPVEVFCLPTKKAEGNDFLPCFVFVLYTPSFTIRMHNGFCFHLIFDSQDYKTRDAQVKQGEAGGLTSLALEKMAL